jgi:hypothetical protein
MNNRCSSCGFLNFATVSACKRCKTPLDEIPSAEAGHQPESYPAAWSGGYEMAAQWPQPGYQPAYFPMPVAALPAKSKNGGTNALLVSLLVGALVVAGGIGILWKFGKASSVNYAWQEYKADDESFTIQMPAKPMETVQTQATPAGNLQMHMSMAILDKGPAFMVAYADYPSSFKYVPADELLDASAQGAVTSSNSVLVSKKKISFDGHPGIEMELEPPPGKMPGGGTGLARIYWVAPRIYIIFAAGPKSAETNAALLKFVNSFKLRKTQG